MISKNTKEGKFDDVKSVITKKNFHHTEENYLLKNLETGMYLFNTQKYCQAIDHFDKAYETTKLQQSTDITSGLSSFFGTGLDIYYGQIYELSLIRFFNSLVNYNVFNEKRCDKYQPLIHSKVSRHNVGLFERQLNESDLSQKLSASRAHIIEWDSFLNGRKVTKDDRFYTQSLLQKIWGAFIHEQRGTITDKQIALQLYKDAKDVALNRYAVYDVFNKNSKSYMDNLDSIEKRKLYLSPDNQYVKDINKFADKQINRLQNNEKANFNILIFNDMISEKKADKMNVPVSVFFKNDSIALYVANLIQKYNVSFEAPVLYNKHIKNTYYYKITNKKTKVSIENKVILVEPISNIAYTDFTKTRYKIVHEVFKRITNNFRSCIFNVLQNRLHRSNVIYFRAGECASVINHWNINGSYFGDGFFRNDIATMAESIKYFCSGCLNDTHKIDARQWVSLPSNIFMTTDRVADGEYNIEIIRRDKNGIDTTIKTQDFVIKDGNTIFIQVLDYDNENIIPKLKQ